MICEGHNNTQQQQHSNNIPILYLSNNKGVHIYINNWNDKIHLIRFGQEKEVWRDEKHGRYNTKDMTKLLVLLEVYSW